MTNALVLVAITLYYVSNYFASSALEVLKNVDLSQGNCQSCWAHMSAVALMLNLELNAMPSRCKLISSVTKPVTLVSVGSDFSDKTVPRYVGGDNVSRGCNGGNEYMALFHFQRRGVFKESNLYQSNNDPYADCPCNEKLISSEKSNQIDLKHVENKVQDIMNAIDKHRAVMVRADLNENSDLYHCVTTRTCDKDHINATVFSRRNSVKNEHMMLVVGTKNCSWEFIYSTHGQKKTNNHRLFIRDDALCSHETHKVSSHNHGNGPFNIFKNQFSVTYFTTRP